MKDCKFTVTVDGKKVVYDYDGFRYFLMNQDNLASIAPSFGTQREPRTKKPSSKKQVQTSKPSSNEGVLEIKPPIPLPLNPYDALDEPVTVRLSSLPVPKTGRFNTGTEAAAYIAGLHERFKGQRKQILDEISAAHDAVQAIKNDTTASPKAVSLAQAELVLTHHKLNSLEAQLKVEGLAALSQGGMADIAFNVREDSSAAALIAKYPEAREYVNKGIELFRRIVGDIPGLTRKDVNVVLFEGRSHYTISQNTVYIDVSEGPRIVGTVVHEAGHWLERHAPNILQQSRAYLARRTANEPLRPLKELLPRAPFNSDEYTKPDKFYSPYMGKYYPGLNDILRKIPRLDDKQLRDDKVWDTVVASELISMGIELYISNPVQFAQQDPDTFAFIYDVLKGER